MGDKSDKKHHSEASERGRVKKYINGIYIPDRMPDKGNALYLAYAKYDEPKHSKRIARLIKDSGYCRTYVYRLAKEFRWQDRYDEAAIAPKSNEEVERYINNPPILHGQDKVSFEAISDAIKEFSFIAIKTTRNQVFVFAHMLNYYCTKMSALLDACGGVGMLSASDAKKLELYEQKIAHYEKQVREYAKPSAVARYLTLIGMKESIQVTPDDNEFGSLTPAALCKLAESAGINLPLEKAGGKVDTIESYVEELGIELPDMDGRIRKKNDTDKKLN